MKSEVKMLFLFPSNASFVDTFALFFLLSAQEASHESSKETTLGFLRFRSSIFSSFSQLFNMSSSTVTEKCPAYSAFFGAMGATAAVVFSGMSFSSSLFLLIYSYSSSSTWCRLWYSEIWLWYFRHGRHAT